MLTTFPILQHSRFRPGKSEKVCRAGSDQAVSFVLSDSESIIIEHSYYRLDAIENGDYALGDSPTDFVDAYLIEQRNRKEINGNVGTME